MKKLSILVIVAAVVLAGCTPAETPKELKGISLNKQTLEMDMGDSFQLIVLYEPEEAEDGAPAVTWQCTQERVATVSPNGRVEAKQKGKATIVATCGKFTAECKLEVVTGSTPVIPPDPDKFNVTPTEINAPAAGGTYTLNVTSTLAWNAVCGESWASVSPENGDGDAKLTVTVEANEAETADEQNITFTAGEFTAFVTIRRGAQAVVSKYVAKPFSISDKQKVVFSQGNLQYHCKDQKWRFAEQQYDFAGKNTRDISATYDGWIDLFSWGTGDDPTFLGAGVDEANRKATFADWGNNTISNGNGSGWYTMNDTCWKYIISERVNAASLKGFAMVNGVNGCVLLPDQWEQPEATTFTAGAIKYTDNQYSVSEWGKMEAAGAVFLPAAESRDVRALTDKDGIFSSGWYWTNSPNGYDCCAYMVYFSEEAGRIGINSSGRSYGHTVRLVKSSY